MTIPSLVVFDLAGTTVEDRGQVPEAFAAALAAHGYQITTADIDRVRGAAKRQAIRQLLTRLHADASTEQSSEAEAERIYATFRDELACRYRDGGVRSIDGAEQVFRRLHAAGATVVLNTGFDREIALLILSSLGWTRTLIDAVVCGDDVANGRPAPDMILLAMQMSGIEEAARVAVVGDTTLDLEAASRAGVKWNIGVLTGAHSRAALEKAPHTHIVQSVANLDTLFADRRD